MGGVAIIGGGASGQLVAAALKRLDPDGDVTIIDRRPYDGGLAYGDAGPAHLLNVPARAMGADAERPAAFLEWARRHRDPALTGDEFLPRQWYGAYLAATADAGGVRRMVAEVEAVERRGFRWDVRAAGEVLLSADAVVLALGNPPSPQLSDTAPGNHGSVVERPFDPDAFDGISPSDSVLVVGTGLTAVDVVLELERRRHVGPLRMISRSGLLPSSHCDQGRCPYHSLGSGTDIRPISSEYRSVLARGGPADVLRALRREIDARPGQCWQSSLDLLMRHELAGLWQRWSDADRRRFVHRLAGRYDRLRHRMAPVVADGISALLGSGSLSVEQGNVSRVVERDGRAVVVPAVGCAPAPADWVINARGPDHRIQAFGAVVEGLVRSGCARPGWGGLGIDVDPDGRVLETTKLPAKNLFALGPLCRGARWETTAMAEVRVQAARIASILAEGGERQAEATPHHKVETSRERPAAVLDV